MPTCASPSCEPASTTSTRTTTIASCDPDPLQFVRQQTTDPDREVVGLIASALAYGNVKQIKRSIARVVEPLAPIPRRRSTTWTRRRRKSLLRGFKHRFNDGRDVACLPPVPEADARARRDRWKVSS
jgi:hypothetical protein